MTITADANTIGGGPIVNIDGDTTGHLTTNRTTRLTMARLPDGTVGGLLRPRPGCGVRRRITEAGSKKRYNNNRETRIE